MKLHIKLLALFTAVSAHSAYASPCIHPPYIYEMRNSSQLVVFGELVDELKLSFVPNNDFMSSPIPAGKERPAARLRITEVVERKNGFEAKPGDIITFVLSDFQLRFAGGYPRFTYWGRGPYLFFLKQLEQDKWEASDCSKFPIEDGAVVIGSRIRAGIYSFSRSVDSTGTCLQQDRAKQLSQEPAKEKLTPDLVARLIREGKFGSYPRQILEELYSSDAVKAFLDCIKQPKALENEKPNNSASGAR